MNRRIMGLVLYFTGVALLYYDAYLISSGRQLETGIYAMIQLFPNRTYGTWIAGFAYTAIMAVGTLLYFPFLTRPLSRAIGRLRYNR